MSRPWYGTPLFDDDDPQGRFRRTPVSMRGHRNCRLTLRDVAECADMWGRAERPAEIWFVRAGLDGAASDWWDAQPVEVRTAYAADLPNVFVIQYERPYGGVNTVVVLFSRDEAGEPRVGCRTFHICDEVIELETSAPPTHILRAAACREYAALPLPARPHVDIDVAEAKGDAYATPPTILVVRWRKRHPTPADDAAPTEVAWSHRWIVRAHLRRLPDGRLTAVRQHVKGPEDRPLVFKRRIDELRR